MNSTRILLAVLLPLLGSASLCAQQHNRQKTVHSQTEKTTTTADSTIKTKTGSLREKAKSDAASLKSSLKTQSNTLTPDSTGRQQLKKHSGEKLEQKNTTVEYNSENPENAPWKKNPFSKEDACNVALPSLPGKDAASDKAREYSDPLTGPGAPGAADVQGKLKQQAASAAGQHTQEANKARHNADSLLALKERASAANAEQELLGAKKVHSEKYIQKLYDSLGVNKADSILGVANTLAKTETPKEELLDRVNSPLKERAGKAGVGFDEKTQSLKVADADKLGGVSDQVAYKDLSALQLPADVLSELPPLSGNLTDSEYMPVVDSMRAVAMKAKGYKLDENEVTGEMKTAVYEKKPRFIDRSYLEGILSFVNDSTFSIVQISPAWACHLTDYLSAGLGPNFSMQYEKDRINVLAGFRTFVKTEFMKQRVYAQVEDNVTQARINKDAARTATHSVLVGGGGLLPLWGKIALNLSLLYRVNRAQGNHDGSPWVLRVGLSSVKKTGKR